MEKNFLQNFSLEGKVALVTGASYGIGFGIATAFAQCGATIVFNDIKQELVDKGLAAYKEKGIEAHGYVCDVTDEAAVNALVARIEKEVGVIDILVEQCRYHQAYPDDGNVGRRVPPSHRCGFERSVHRIESRYSRHDQKRTRQNHHICSMMSELGREPIGYAAAKGGPEDADAQYLLGIRRIQHPM